MPALPEPMLSRLSRELPLGDYAYELKWDGLRAMVSTADGLRVRSRRGWDMTELLPELADLPPRLVLDGELIAFGEDGKPDFPGLCRRMLHGRRRVGSRSRSLPSTCWQTTATAGWTGLTGRDADGSTN